MTLRLLLQLPGKFLCGDIFFTLHPQASLVAAVIAGVIVIPLPVIYLLMRRRDMLLWVVWLGTIVGFFVCTDLLRRSVYLQYLRYPILASPAVYAMIAGARKPVAMVALAGCLYLAVTRAIVGVPAKGDWRQLSEVLETYVPQDQVLAVYYADPFVSPGLWYMAQRYYQPESNRPWLLLRSPADEKLRADLRARGTVWLEVAEGGPIVREILPGWRIAEELDTPISIIYRLVPESPTTSRP